MNLILPNEYVSEKHVKSLTGSVHKSRNLERIDFQFDILTRPDKTTPPTNILPDCGRVLCLHDQFLN